MSTQDYKDDKAISIGHLENGGMRNEDLSAGEKLASNRREKDEAGVQETLERNMGMMEAVRMYPMACFWAFVMAFTIVMESFDMFLIGNFVALPAFKQRFGVVLPGTNPIEYAIPAKWQTGLTIAGQGGALLGIFISGPVTNRYGYKKATILGLILMNATIFVSFFADSLPVFLIGQLLEGIPWGFFIANAPAYASEVVPLQLRGTVTASLQMFWAIGSVIVAGATYGINGRTDSSAWKIPLALQWIFPGPLLVLIWFMPESPYWLLRHGRPEDARRSITRLGRSTVVNAEDTFAMISRTVAIEQQTIERPSYLDLFKGSDCRRTLIICAIYAGQNLAGNLIANQAVFFFEQAGIDTHMAFALGLITSSLQIVAVMGSWLLSAWFGRRAIYLWGTAVNIVMLFALGGVAFATQTTGTEFAQAVLGLLISVQFCLSAGPIAYTIIAETSSVRLRPLSTGFGRAAYYAVELPCIYLGSQMLNPTGWRLYGKCGLIWGSTALVCWVGAYFYLPELKNRSYRESDILFKRGVPARKFASTHLNLEDEE